MAYQKKIIVLGILGLVIITATGYFVWRLNTNSQPSQISNNNSKTAVNGPQDTESLYCPSKDAYPDGLSLDELYLKTDPQITHTCSITSNLTLVLTTKFAPVDSGYNYQEYKVQLKDKDGIQELGTYSIGTEGIHRLRIEPINDSVVRVHNNNPSAGTAFRKQWYINTETSEFVGIHSPEDIYSTHLPALDVIASGQKIYQITLIGKREGDYNRGEKLQATGISVNKKPWQTFSTPYFVATPPKSDDVILQDFAPQFENIVVSNDLKTISFSLTHIGQFTFPLN